jgi:hypothetical protein
MEHKNCFYNCFVLLFLFMFMLFAECIAQNSKEKNDSPTGFLRGFVADSLSGEPLPFSNVYIKELNRGAVTDSKGYFVIASLPVSALKIEISCIGYSVKTVTVKIQRDVVTDIRVLLSSSNIQLHTIEARSKRNRENEPDISLQRISMAEIEYQPKGVEADIFRSLQNLAGIQTGGDLSAGFYVRGSAGNENLILLDNTPVYNPFHAMGILSSIDPDVINSLEVYKGGFSTEFSGRLSSVIKINTKDGNKNTFGGKAGISLLTAKLFLDGPFPGGSFIISGRQNYSDQVLKKFNNDNPLPVKFYDLFAKINIADDDFMEDAKFTITTFLSNDKIENGNPMLEDFKWKNNLFEFNYLQVSDSPLFYQINASSSLFEGERIPNQSGAKYMKNTFTDYNVRMDFNYVYESKDVLKGGLKIEEVHSKQFLKNLLGIQKDIYTTGVSLSAYADYQWLRNSFLGLDAGVRIHGTRLAGGGPSYFLEPRTSFTLRILPELALKGSWGLYMQDLVTSTDENEVATPFESWVITPESYTPSTSIQYCVGIDVEPNEQFSFQVESYYKRMQNLLIVNMQKIYITDPDFINGSGESYGVEVTGKYQAEPLLFAAAYSWMKSLRTVGGFVYSPRFDTRNNLNLSLQANLGAGWVASASWIYNTGRPFTKIAGFYDQLTPTQLADNPFLLNSYSQTTVYSTLNAGTLPDYHRLDLSLAKKIQINRLKLSADIGVINVYNRKNLFYIKRDTGERVNMLPLMPSVNIKVEL